MGILLQLRSSLPMSTLIFLIALTSLKAEDSEMKKVVIFGSTGMTGLATLEAAINKGLQVRAFVRDPAKLPEKFKSKVEVFKGDVLKPETVYEAVKGVDGVIVVLGTRNNLGSTTVMSEGTKNIIEGMKRAGVKKLSVLLSYFMLFEPSQVPGWVAEVHADHMRMYEAMKTSGLDYVAVCPPNIDDTKSRDIQVFINTLKGSTSTISKWDLGKFMIDSLSEPSYYNNKVVVCNPRRS